MPEIDVAVAPIFARQHGVISRAQILSAGGTGRQIETRVRSGAWLRYERAVYRHSMVQPSWPGRLLAACLSLRGIASHRSAAALWQLDGCQTGHVEVTIAAHSGNLRDGITIHESLRLDLASRVIRNAIPCTGVARTLFDLAATLPDQRLVQAVDDARRKKLVEFDDLYGLFVRYARRGRPGSAAMRAFLVHNDPTDPVPLSHWSRLVALDLIDAGLPAPELEYQVVVRDGRRAFIDIAYPAQKVGIELDSVRWHHNLRSFETDRQRRNWLQNQGWSILNFTWQDYVRPGHLARIVKTAIAQRTY